MLAVSPLRNPKNESEAEMEGLSIADAEFPDFAGVNLLDSIDFDDLFLGIGDGDVLPDLEMDPELLAEFSASASDESELRTAPLDKSDDENTSENQPPNITPPDPDESASVKDETNPPPKETDGGRKSISQISKNSPTKRKVKVINC